MAKWADKIIYSVRYNQKHTHIDQVKCAEDKGDNLGSEEILSRQQVVSALKSGKTFCTATKNQNGKWAKGALVEIFPVQGQEFIKTKADNTPTDNLENLPEF